MDRELDRATRSTLLIDGFVDDGRAELNVDFAAAIPVLTITGSFGVPVEQALDHPRVALSDRRRSSRCSSRSSRPGASEPSDDLISVLVEAEYTDEDGVLHRLSDAEIYSFAMLLLAAGSGTTWKQMGITLAALLQRPEVLDAVRDDRALLRPAIEESLRWMPTDPMFSRWVTRDVELPRCAPPRGRGAAPRASAPPTATRRAGSGPTSTTSPGRRSRRSRSAAARTSASACTSPAPRWPSASARCSTGCPNLRLDPDAEPPRFIGMYERGATAIPVVFG